MSDELSRNVARLAASYLYRIPDEVPPGKVVVHNNVRHAGSRLGSRGFRAWLDNERNERLERCDCGWAPELGAHYRIRRQGEEAAG